MFYCKKCHCPLSGLESEHCVACGPSISSDCSADFADDKRQRDLESIRFAMQQVMDTFDAYATLADKTDEAVLNGMRAMMAAFDAEVRMCDSR